VNKNRRAALEGLSKILDAGSPEELFVGSDEEALFLYDLLVETARARSSVYYWEICRTARRRGVTPEFVVDRAVVLLATMNERRRMDLYRVLGVPPLASAETIRRRWLDVAKRAHPDAGGDGAAFRHAKQAYEVLRDATRRAEYERFWLRALGPFERVLPREEGALLEAMEASVRSERRAAVALPAVPVVLAAENGPPAAAASAPAAGALAEALAAAERVFAARRALDARVALPSEPGATGIGAFLARIEASLAAIPHEELERLRGEAARVQQQLESLRDRLAGVAALRRTLTG
jgi:hypothetical protein